MKRILFLLIIVLTLTSCSYTSFDHIEDENGSDDYSLANITEEDIINNKSSISYISIYTNDTDSGRASIEIFSGVKKITSFSGKDKIIVSFTVTEGNASLALATKDEIIHYFNINENNQEYVIDTNKKLYLKLAGESAKINLEYKYE